VKKESKGELWTEYRLISVKLALFEKEGGKVLKEKGLHEQPISHTT